MGGLQKYLLYDDGLNLLKFMLIYNVFCGAGVCFHFSLHPINANLNLGVVECFWLVCWELKCKIRV